MIEVGEVVRVKDSAGHHAGKWGTVTRVSQNGKERVLTIKSDEEDRVFQVAEDFADYYDGDPNGS